MIAVPRRLVDRCDSAWVADIPRIVEELRGRWSLEIGDPFDSREVSCAWVAPAERADGSRAVFKVGMPHMEAAHEIDGLRWWAGDPTVLLLDSDAGLNAMLLEACEPGRPLRALPEPEQDVVIAGLLRRSWRKPSDGFRPLSEMLTFWSSETLADEDRWPDSGLVREGLRLFDELSRAAPDDVLLHTDLHAGNVLAARREPWLAIDPKPFVGDAAYDATQHLLNCLGRVRSDPDGTIQGFAELLDLDHERVRLWLFARAAAESRDDWTDLSLARLLAP